MSWPAWQSLVASVIPPHLRQRYFGVNFTLLNLGIGIGGVVGGLFVDVADVATFQAIYLADAASYLPALLLLLGPLRHVAGRVVVAITPETAPMSYVAVLRSPADGQPDRCSASSPRSSATPSSTPGCRRTRGRWVRSRPAGSGFAFAANTLVIVVLQLFVLQRIEGRRRTRVIAVMGVVWALAWFALGFSGLVPGTLGATLLVAACASVFAFGETLLQPTIPALVNDLAPDHLRGRLQRGELGVVPAGGGHRTADLGAPHRARPRIGLHRAAGGRLPGLRSTGRAPARAAADPTGQRRARAGARAHFRRMSQTMSATTAAAPTPCFQ